MKRNLSRPQRRCLFISSIIKRLSGGCFINANRRDLLINTRQIGDWFHWSGSFFSIFYFSLILFFSPYFSLFSYPFFFLSFFFRFYAKIDSAVVPLLITLLGFVLLDTLIYKRPNVHCTRNQKEAGKKTWKMREILASSNDDCYRCTLYRQTTGFLVKWIHPQSFQLNSDSAIANRWFHLSQLDLWFWFRLLWFLSLMSFHGTRGIENCSVIIIR